MTATNIKTVLEGALADDLTVRFTYSKANGDVSTRQGKVEAVQDGKDFVLIDTPQGYRSFKYAGISQLEIV